MKMKSLKVIPMAMMVTLAAAAGNAQSAFTNALMQLDPVAYWPLQDTAQPPGADVETNYGSLGPIANAYYSSTNVLHGQPGALSGDSDTSVTFNGGNGSFLAVPGADPRTALLSGPFTVEAWVNPANTSSYIGIISKAGPNPGGLNNSTIRGGWILSQNYLAYDDGNKMQGWSFHVYNGQGSGNGGAQGGAEAGVLDSYTTGTWYYLAAVFDGSNCTLYVDGTNMSSANSGYTIPMSGSYVPDTWDPLCIGCGRGLNDNRFDGGVDEVAIYTNALSPADIQAHYSAAGGSGYSSTVLADKPLMYWRMDNNSYTPPASTAYPLAANLGSVAGLEGLYLSGDTPGVAGPSFPGLGSLTNACAFNGIGTDNTNVMAVFTNGVALGTNIANSGIVITNQDPSLLLTSNSFSMVCWFKGNPADNRFQGLVSQGNNSWRLAFGSGGNTGHLQFNSGWANNPGDLVSPEAFNDGNWHFAACVSSVTTNILGTDGSGNLILSLLVTNILYVDGVEQGMQVNSNAAPQAGQLVPMLGGAPDYLASGGASYNQRFFAGDLAHVAFFTNALSAAQVVNLYTNANGGMMPAPEITSQPYPYPAVRTYTGGPGTYVYEAVVANGNGPLAYQWYFNGTSSNYAGASALEDDGTHIVASQTYELTITNIVQSDSGYYFCVVSDSFGQSVTSAIVDVQMEVDPTIISQSPAGNFSLFRNQTATLSVTVGGATNSLGYQWYTNGVADTSAGGGATYTFPEAPVPANESFQCVVTNSFGSVTSALATASVQALPAALTTSAYATNILALNPTVYFPMHESGTAAPGDTETNYGTLGALGTGYYGDWNVNNGAPDGTWVLHQFSGAISGDSDSAVYLEGNNGNDGNSHLLIPHTSPLTTLKPPFSVEFWVYPNNADFGDIVTQDGTWLHGGSANHQNTDGIRIVWNRGNIQLYGAATINTTGTALALNKWHHVVLTYDGSNMVYYVDGNEAANGTTTSFTPDYWDPLMIGCGFWTYNAGGNYNIPFGIDEVAIYTNVLSSSAVSTHYNDGTHGAAGQYFTDVIDSEPVLYYRMDSPTFTAPAMSTWPIMTNYGTAMVNGVYSPGTTPGAASGPNSGNISAGGFSANNALAANGLSTFAEAFDPAAFDPAGMYTPFTVSLWFKGNPADDSRYQSLTSEGTGWQINQGQNGGLDFWLTHDFSSKGVYNDGLWHQAVVTYSTNVLALYVDGVLDNISTNSGYTNPPPDTADFTGIGCDSRYLASTNNSGSGRQYAGDLCEFAFWNGTALTPNQVQSLYNSAGTAPRITQQPISATVNAGRSFTNSVTVIGSAPLTYQWYRDGQPLPIGGQNNLPEGANNSTLILSPVQPTDASTNYYVVIANTGGSVTSAVVTLNVTLVPVITNSTPAPYTNLFTLYAGVSPAFAVGAEGALPLTYYWFTNGVPVGDDNSPAFTWTNVQAAFTNYCVVSNSFGTATNVWAATVLPDPTEAYPLSVLADDPVGYWRLNEGPDDGAGNEGVLTHDYVGGNDGLYTNVILDQTGYNPSDASSPSVLFGEYIYNNSITNEQAGQIQGIDFSSPTNTSRSFTVEAWVNGNQQEVASAGIVTKGYGNGGEQFDLDVGGGLNADSDPSYRFFFRDATGAVHSAANTNYAPVGDGTWHHLAGVVDESNGYVALYVDGQQVASSTFTPGLGVLSSPLPMSIGARTSGQNTGFDEQFDGNISDVAVYNHALSADEIANQYSSVGIAPPFFIVSPPANVVVTNTSNLSISAVAGGPGPLNYTWHDPNNNILASGSTSGTTLDASLTLNNIPAVWNNNSLELTVQNGNGSTNVYVMLTIPTNAPALTLPAQVSVGQGKPYALTVGVYGVLPLSYQWYSGASPLMGQTNASYLPSTATPGNATYSVVVTNVYGASTDSVIFTVVPLPGDKFSSDILNLKPVGYWPLQETNPAAVTTIETNYGTLGALGNAYYAGTNAAAAGTGGNIMFDQTPGALTGSGDTDPAITIGGGNNDSYLFVPNRVPALILKAPLTFECWFNPNSSSPFGDLMGDGGAPGDGSGNWGGIRISYQTGGSLQTYEYTGNGSSYDSTSTAGGLLTAGKWHQCVMTYDGTNFLVYVDGVQEVKTTDTKIIPSDYVPLTIGTGRWDQGPTRTPEGQIDEVAVYTNALTALQVTNHYLSAITAGSNYMQTVLNDKPLLYYRMDASFVAPTPAEYPEAINFGSAQPNGAYQAGTAPGEVAGPQIAAMGSNTVAAAINGIFSCVDAGYDPSFNPTGLQPFTAMCWFRGNPWDERTQAIIGQGGNWAMNIDNATGRIIWNLYSAGQVTSTTVLNDGNWHQLVGVFDGANSYLYVDGALNSSIAAAGALAGDTNANLYLGGDVDYTYNGNASPDTERYFAGDLAQVALFTNALTAAEIQSIYHDAVPAAVSLNPTNIVFSVSGQNVMLSWPQDHTGWMLQAQTNRLGVGISTNWVDVGNSTLTNQLVIPINLTNGSVFYRLIYQQ